jgi:ribosomal protein L31
MYPLWGINRHSNTPQAGVHVSTLTATHHRLGCMYPLWQQHTTGWGACIHSEALIDTATQPLAGVNIHPAALHRVVAKHSWLGCIFTLHTQHRVCINIHSNTHPTSFGKPLKKPFGKDLGKINFPMITRFREGTLAWDFYVFIFFIKSTRLVPWLVPFIRLE